MKCFILVLLALSPQLLAQTATYNPTALTDYSPCSTLYLSTYNTCLYDSTPFSSGTGTNTPPSGYNTDSIAAMNRVVPLDSTGAACSGPPYAPGCNIIVLLMGMSIAGRDSCYGTAVQSATCVAESFICQAVGLQTGANTGCTGTGNVNVNHRTDTGGGPLMKIVNCGQESQEYETWQNNANGDYGRCDTDLQNNGVTPSQVEVVIFLDVDNSPQGGGSSPYTSTTCCDIAHLNAGIAAPFSGNTCDSRDYPGTTVAYPANNGASPYPNTSIKSTIQPDLCMLMVNIGLISRYIKTFRYPNTQQMFLNTINYTGYCISSSTCTAQPEPFAYETGFGIRNVIQAQIKQRAGGYSSPSSNAMTKDINYDCNGNPGGSGNAGGTNCTGGNTSCTCTGGACAAGNVGHAWACAPIIEWGTYEWAPACTAGGGIPGGTRLDGFCWNYADFTHADNVHPKSLSTGSYAGVMKVSNGMLVSGNLVGGTVSYYLNNPYATWFQASAPPPPPSTGVEGVYGNTTLNGGAAIQ